MKYKYSKKKKKKFQSTTGNKGEIRLAMKTKKN